MKAEIISIQVGKPKEIVGIDEKRFVSGILKEKTDRKVFADKINLQGDRQADLKNHGGYDKAVNVYPFCHFQYFNNAFSLKLTNGSFGENFTTRGLTEETVFIGDIFKIGDALFEVSQPRQPCWKISAIWIKGLHKELVKTGFTGWYFRVVKTGFVNSGNSIELAARKSDWSIKRSNTLLYSSSNKKELMSLANCQQLSESWKISLIEKAKSL